MRPLDDVSLNHIESIDDVHEFLRWLEERRDVLAFDLEATGLRYWRPGYRITLAQFGDCDVAWSFRPDRFGVLLEDVLTKYTGQFTGHNLYGFDFHVLAACGFSLPDPRRVDDTLILSKLAEADQFGHGLDAVARRHVGKAAEIAKHVLDETFEAHGFRKTTRDPDEGERAWTEIARIGPEAFTVYSCMDVISAARAWAVLRPKVRELFEPAYQRELGAWMVTWEHEHRGIRVDLDYANKLHDEMSGQIDIVRAQLAELGLPNPGARTKLIERLKEDGWIPNEYTRTLKPKLDKSILEGIDNELVEPLVEYHRLTKWRTAYVESVIKNQHNGRVYPNVNVMGAKTGRQSMTNPPVHQMPSRHPDAWKMRRLYLPEEGDAMVSIDYAAQEDRLSTHFSGDRAYREIFDKGLDKHTYTAAGVYQIPYDSVTTEQRSLIKGWSYAAAYGAQDKKLAKMIGVTVDEVALIRERVNSVYTGFVAYSKRLEEEGRAQYLTEGAAYALTLGGRRVYADQGKYGEPKYFQLLNYINQGTGADILKETQNRIAAAGLSKHLVFELHDEVLLTVPRGPEGDEIAREIGRLMEYREGDDTFGTPITIDMLTSVGEQEAYWSGH